jgi:hypothetical protein
MVLVELPIFLCGMVPYGTKNCEVETCDLEFAAVCWQEGRLNVYIAGVQQSHIQAVDTITVVVFQCHHMAVMDFVVFSWLWLKCNRLLRLGRP